MIDNKNKITITQKILLKAISERTSLTQPQVKECIDVMCDLIQAFTLHPDCSTVFEFKLGEIGKFTLKPHSGRKVGTYQMPDGFSSSEKAKNVIVVDEEEPSYQKLSFQMFTRYKQNLKEASKKRSIEQGWKARNGKIVPINQEDEV